MSKPTHSRRPLLALTLVLLVSASVWWWLARPASGPDALPASPHALSVEQPAAEIGSLSALESSRAKEESPALPAAAQETRAGQPVPAPKSQELLDVRGRLLDARGNGLGAFGIAIAPHSQEPPQEKLTAATTTGSDGRFLLRQVPVASGLVIADPRWVTVRSAYVSKQAAAVELIVIAAPAVELAGTVADASGSGVAGVELTVAPKSGFWVTYAHPLDVTVERKYLTTSDGAGRFRFQRAPSFDGSVLSAQ